MKLSEKTIQKLKDKKISIEDLNAKYLCTQKGKINRTYIDNILILLNENICSFKEIVDKYKYKNHLLFDMLENKELFQELIENNLLTKEDLNYLLNRLDRWVEVSSVCDNTPLIKFILNEFVLDKELVDKLNRLLEEEEWFRKYRPTIFVLLDRDKNNEEITKLSKLNKYTYSSYLDENERLKLIEVLKNNEIAQNKLIQIIENHLESIYDFESLMNYLNKQEKKRILNI